MYTLKIITGIFILLFCNNAIAQQFEFSDDESIRKVKKKLHADSIIADRLNEDGVYLARKKRTQKWGMYQFYKLCIPAEYDSISFFRPNAPFTRVWKNGKVGIVSSPWDDVDSKSTLLVACIYDDCIIVNSEYELFLKVKKDKKWGMIDWRTGDILIDLKYMNPNEFSEKDIKKT